MSSTEITKLETRWRENPHGLTFAPLAEAYRKQRDPQRALEVLAEGLARHPDYIPASIVLGRCHLDLADDTRAEAAFVRVLEFDDENVIALKALADILERQGRLADAASRLRSLLAVDRSNDEARAQLSRLEATAREAPPPRRDDEPAAASAEEHLSPDDFVWDDPAPSSAEAPATADLLLEDNLRPTGEVERLPDIEIDEPPAIHGEVAAAMPGLVGEDFPEHRAGVVPLADLAPGTAAIGEHALFDDDDRDEELSLAHSVSSEDESPRADPETAGEAMVEPISELERSAEIELTPSGASEFQINSVSDEWAAGSLAGGDAADLGDSLERAESPFDRVEAAADDALTEVGAAGDESATSAEFPVEPFAEEAGRAADETAAAESGADWIPELETDAAFAQAPQYDDSADEDYDSDEEPTSPPLPDDLVVTESMAELFLRQGHRAEALLVYRELYHRNRDDLRLREKVDSLETALAAEEAASPRGRSYAARERGRSVASFLSGIFGARPADAPSAWIAAPVPPAPAPAAIEAASESGDAAPTRPASDHLSLSDVFGDTGSPVPPAVAAAAGASADDGVSFDTFFGEAAGATARSRGGTRDDEDLDQFHAWLQNLKR